MENSIDITGFSKRNKKKILKIVKKNIIEHEIRYDKKMLKLVEKNDLQNSLQTAEEQETELCFETNDKSNHLWLVKVKRIRREYTDWRECHYCRVLKIDSIETHFMKK